MAFDQETDPRYNTRPGVVPIPGSHYQREMAQFEQFPFSKWALGSPGNPYVYRPFPKMLYKALRWRGPKGEGPGKFTCCAAPVDPYLPWRDHTERVRAEEAVQRFNQDCQRIVNDEREYQIAMEQGYREDVADAVAWAEEKEEAIATDTAHRNYEDRNMSAAAKAEIDRQTQEAGGAHQAEKIADPVEAPTQKLIADGKCNGTKADGKRCTRNATQGFYCKSHDV